METLRPNHTRAKHAMIMIAIVMSIEVLTIASDYLEYQLMEAFLAGAEISYEEADANDIRQLLISTSYLAAMLISVVTFIRWFRRAYYNLRLLRNDVKHTDGWAAGAWFIPIVCLYLPYQIMKELYKKTHEYLIADERYTEKLSTRIVSWWWGFWIFGSYISNITARFIWKADTARAIADSNIMSMVSSIFLLISGTLVLMVINNYSEVELLVATKQMEELNDVNSSNIDN